MSRPCPNPKSSLLLPPALCAPVSHYVGAWAVGESAVDYQARFNKRYKAAHRFEIADTRGRMTLTVPIAKPESSRCSWADIRISPHGRWWDVHRVALESAYGRTPYFEFYIDTFLPMLTEGVVDRFPMLASLSRAWDEAIRSLLGMEEAATALSAIDSASLHLDALPPLQPYRQIRAPKLGFIPGLSAVDLLFNLGPEAALYLNAEARRLFTPGSLPT